MDCIFNNGCNFKDKPTCCFSCKLLGWCEKHDYSICKNYKYPHHEIYKEINQHQIDLEHWFLNGINKLKNPNNSFDILNWYRNLYYKEDKDTERGKMAWAINKVFMELKELGVDLKNLSDEDKK